MYQQLNSALSYFKQFGMNKFLLAFEINTIEMFQKQIYGPTL